MHLLSELYSQPQVDTKTVVEKPLFLDLNEAMMDDHSLSDTAAGAEDDPFLLSSLAPRLWPFMRHNITSVRLAAVRTLVCPSGLSLLCTCPRFNMKIIRKGL